MIIIDAEFFATDKITFSRAVKCKFLVNEKTKNQRIKNSDRCSFSWRKSTREYSAYNN